MTVLVTGASGLIGSHLCQELAKKDCDVVALAHRSISPLLRSVAEKCPRVAVRQCDIRDERRLSDLVNQFRPGTVFHLAACCLPHHSDSDYTDANVRGTSVLVKALQKAGTEEIIYSSSLSVYSTPPAYLPVDELHPTKPHGMYGWSKLAGENICKRLSGTMETTILRFASVFGVGDTTRVAGVFVGNALSGEPLLVQGDGSQSSDFIYVEDAVSGIMLSWEHKATGVYNIGSERQTTIKELAQIILRITESKSHIELSGVTNRPFQFASDITKAQRDLEYQPAPLEEGLKKYVEELRAQRQENIHNRW